MYKNVSRTIQRLYNENKASIENIDDFIMNHASELDDLSDQEIDNLLLKGGAGGEKTKGFKECRIS